MLILKSFAPAMGIRCPSLFGLKAEALLAMSGLDYKVRNGDVRKAPKGKLPVLVDGDTTIADSSVIQRHLEENHGIDFDGSLSPEQRAIAKGIQRLIENHLYFAITHYRWIEFPERARDAFFKDIPAIIRKPLFSFILRKIKRDNFGHGMGRHDRSEILAFAREDLDALSDQLGDKPFMLDDTPTSVDATVYGALENIINSAETSDLRDAARTHDNLVTYCDRFRETVFGDKAAR